MDKRGVQSLQSILIYFVIIMLVVVPLSIWINNTSQGKLVSEQAVVKQVALLIDAAEPGSLIFINAEVKIEGNRVKMGLSEYEFFSADKVSYNNVNDGTEIRLE